MTLCREALLECVPFPADRVVEPPLPGHHLAHAYSAYGTAPFANCAVLVIDEQGHHIDGSFEKCTWYEGANGPLTLVDCFFGSGDDLSLGMLYNAFAAMTSLTEADSPAAGKLMGLARISHTIFARSQGLRDELIRVSGTCSLVASEDASRSWDFSGAAGAANNLISRWAWGRYRGSYACGAACHSGEPRALAAALRRVAARPHTAATGQLEAMANLMRRTLTRTRAPILSSLRRIVPQLTLQNAV